MFNKIALRLVFCIFTFMTTLAIASTSRQFNDALNYLTKYPNFDLSLKRYGESRNTYTWLFDGEEAPQRDYFKFKLRIEKLYNLRRKFPSLNNKEAIPRIIHQIWLGSPVPEKYQVFMKTWQGWEGWTYILWTDEDVKGLSLRNQHLYDQAENFGEKADILRFELLNLFGGLYVDIDFACLEPPFFNFAHQQYAFYIGVEPLEHAPVSCCNAIMASIPGHPIIKKMISELDAHVEQFPKSSGSSVEERTGPRYVSKIIALNFQLLRGGIIFPPTFFYPIHAGELDALYHNKKRFIRAETMAIHFWTGSWRPDESLIKK